MEDKKVTLELELYELKVELSKITELKQELQELKTENKELEKQIKILKQGNKELKKVQKVHNERGAGRKSKFTDSEKETIKMYRLQGKTIKEIADIFGCSVGLVHKLINE